MKEKVMEAIEGKDWKLLGHYMQEYPTNWIKTINKCLNDDENVWSFAYDSNGELKWIKIITNYGVCNSRWNYYIVFN